MSAFMLTLALLGATPSSALPAPIAGESGPKTSDDEAFSDAQPPLAPKKPAPWLKSPYIHFAQVLGGFGARALTAPCLVIPVAGPLVVALAGPVLEAIGIVWTGDRLGDGRAGVVFPLLTSIAAGGTGALLMAVGAAGGLATLGVVFVVVGGVPAPGVPIPSGDALRLGVSLGALAITQAALVLQLAGALLMGISPVLSTAVYQATKTRKAQTDNGTELPRLMPWPRTPPQPPKKDSGKPAT